MTQPGSNSPAPGDTPPLDMRHYAAALEEELDRVNRERLLLRAALNQQAETLTATAAECQRWKELASATAENGHRGKEDVNNRPAADSAV